MTSRWRGNGKGERARRDKALMRPELRSDTVTREAAAGPTSFPIKKSDPITERLIQEASRQRGNSHGV
jgi:hypothetical protein